MNGQEQEAAYLELDTVINLYCGADKYLPTNHTPNNKRRPIGALNVYTLEGTTKYEVTALEPVYKPKRSSRRARSQTTIKERWQDKAKENAMSVTPVCRVCGQRYYFGLWMPALLPMIEKVIQPPHGLKTLDELFAPSSMGTPSRAAYDLFRTWLRLEHPQIFKQLPAVEALAADRSVPTLVMQRLGLLDTP